jgi:ADP-ribose pyrophosphatase
MAGQAAGGPGAGGPDRAAAGGDGADAGSRPPLPGWVLQGADLADRPESWPARERQRMTGAVSTFVRDDVTAPDGAALTREWVRHPGAVAILAVDEFDRVAVVTQYRHPAGHVLVEAPAGLLDAAGEAPLAAAQRELAEEVQLQAADWRVLVDWYTSPGSSEETIRLYLARGLVPVSRPAGFTPEGEEAAMGVGWVGLDDALRAVYEGRLQSPPLLLGCLAYWNARAAGALDRLRSGDAPWPARLVKAARDKVD